MKRILLSFLTIFLFTGVCLAEDIDAIFKRVQELTAKESYPKALAELVWAQKEIEKKHFAKLQSLLPDSLAGFTGNQSQSNSALGMTNIEKTYTKASDKVKVSIIGGNLPGAPAAGGLAALGRMAAMMGNQPGVESFRMDGRTASLELRGNRAELSVFLESGSVLKIEQRKAADGDTVKKMAEELKVGEIDSYLKGS